MNLNIILQISHLKMHFPTAKDIWGRNKSVIRAVDDISFNVYRGETLGLCGESGCGKSTLARCIDRLYVPTSGEIFFEGADISGIPESRFRKIRSKISLVFQDPYNSLDPRQKIRSIVIEPIKAVGLHRGKSDEDIVHRLLQRVGLDPHLASHYPHELSGGQRQRVGIARALASDPELVILDEPISSLDASVQAQILSLLRELHEKRNEMTYIFISHDLSVIQYMSDRVAVMYLGRIVEVAATDEIFRNPLHPYTQMLLSAASMVGNFSENDRLSDGASNGSSGQSEGCNFIARCRHALAECSRFVPQVQEVCAGHEVACLKVRQKRC
jgi:oligopeptide/dipeptide ABC transporter ATP-binding protein